MIRHHRGADDHPRFAIAQYDRRCHRAQRPFAGFDPVGLTLHQAVEIRHTGLGGEVVHFVVEQHPGASGSDARAEPVVECVGYGDGVAFAIDYGIMRGLGRFVRRDAWTKRGGRCRLLRVDRSPDRGGMCGRPDGPLAADASRAGLAPVGVSLADGPARHPTIFMTGIPEDVQYFASTMPPDGRRCGPMCRPR
jgi:hypothetical protein